MCEARLEIVCSLALCESGNCISREKVKYYIAAKVSLISTECFLGIHFVVMFSRCVKVEWDTEHRDCADLRGGGEIFAAHCDASGPWLCKRDAQQGAQRS